MHELLRFAEPLLALLHLVFAGCKPDQAFIVNVDSERVNARESNIDSQVKFEPIESKRIVDVFTADILFVLSLRNVADLVCNDDAAALATCVRLTDPQLPRLFFNLILQVHQLLRQNVGFWDETKVLCTMDFSKS